MARKQRFKLRFTFWVDLLNGDGQELADYIEELKSQRSFARTIREGLRLIRDLRAGRVDVLFELFPLLKAEFLAGVQPQKTAGELELQRQLERLEHHLMALNSRNIPNDIPKPLQPATVDGPRALAVPKFDLPHFDDDEADTLIVQRDTNTDSALNFLNSMMRLQQ
jgi:hypothetical protein